MYYQWMLWSSICCDIFPYEEGRRRVFHQMAGGLFVGLMSESGQGFMGPVPLVELEEIDIQNQESIKIQ